MKDINDIFVVIQARLGSVRVPNKMIRPFAGTTILDIAIQKMLNSFVIPKENFYLSVYEEELKDVGRKYDVNIFERSYESAFTETSMTDMYEWHDKVPYKYAVLINACCPFLRTDTIGHFVKRYMYQEEDGLFGVVRKKNYFWNNNEVMTTKWPEGAEYLDTKRVESCYEAAHCLYAGRLDLIKNNTWMGTFQKPRDPVLFEMEEKEILDIDYEWQFELYDKCYNFSKRDK
jgi:CMP-N-acetylneuraminic acid synthetase